MIIKELFNHHGEFVGKAYMHRKNSTVDIKYDENKIHYGNVTINFNEFENYLDRMDVSTEENQQMGLF